MDVCFRNLKMKKGKGMYCFLLLFIVNFSDASRLAMGNENLEVKNYLTQINKTPVKSIKSPDGDIIDCIRILDQPAFDHPLLKNHTIQMTPNYPEGLSFDDNGDEVSINQLWHLSGSCPDGTIPIRRIKEEDVLRANSVEHFGKKDYKSIPMQKSVEPTVDNPLAHEHALGYVQGGKLFGTRATMNVWKPRVEPHEFSLAQFWILGGPNEDLQTLEAGWHVFPDLYNDSETRFFTYWTTDGYKNTGCYNLLCKGFIQTDQKTVLGGTIVPVSVYGGSQYEFNLTIFKDFITHNWWLVYGKTRIGYWPQDWFPSIRYGAQQIQWGGEVYNTASGGKHTTTEMGSSHFPGEGPGKASYIRNLQIIDEENGIKDAEGLKIHADKPNCYDVTKGYGKSSKNYLYFGGPGRNDNCP